MIPSSTILACVLTLCISLVIPLGILLVLGIRWRKDGFAPAWFIGAAGFFVTQMVIRLPILSLLSANTGFVAFAQEHFILYSLLLAFTAGLFELAGRFAAGKLLKKKPTFRRALAAGLGHGSIEAILLVGITYINNLIYLVLIQTGAFDTLVAQTEAMGVDPSQLLAIKETFLQTGAGLFLLAGLERLLTMVAHTAMSVLMCWGLWSHRTGIGVTACLVIHTLLDSMVMVTYLVPQPASYWILYGFMGLVALFSLYLLRRLRNTWPACEKGESV
ncbi:MAG TPA: YhfC family intramembrane metalloprotease [Candidatus Faecousia intestinavium]|nr:YhfC family intramembrane metalloprotease [Candidatus Faecousia intestinavium]